MLRREIQQIIKEAIEQAQKERLLVDFELSVSAPATLLGTTAGEPDISVERAQDGKFGDYSSNIALKISKQAGRAPMEIAEEISSKFKVQSSKLFEKIEIVKPGFINFFIKKEYLQKQVGKILEQGEKYGALDIGQGRKAQVEFISANPTGPLTLGNGRGGVFGDVLANVLKKVGYDVLREYYLNDAGNQIVILGHSVLKDEQAQYSGAYVDELAGVVKKTEPREVGEEALKFILEGIKKTVADMGIEFDVWFSEEKELRQKSKVGEIIAWMKKENLAYEKEGALWFRAAKFGDSEDRVLIKKDGEPTYFGVDCAYHYNKFIARGFDKVINIWGADHHGDVARVKGFVAALGFENKFEIILMQFVRLIHEGVAMRMSKRKGVYVFVDNVLKEVGRDAFRFFMMMHSADTHMDFDLALAKEQSQKNPVYYVQYAYARIASILRKATPIHEWHTNDTNKLNFLGEPAEMALIKQLIRLPEIIEDTVVDYQVQRLPQYSLELVRSFHKFYEECRVISDDVALSEARLALVEAAGTILKNVLDLMGVAAPEEM